MWSEGTTPDAERGVRSVLAGLRSGGRVRSQAPRRRGGPHVIRVGRRAGRRVADGGPTEQGVVDRGRLEDAGLVERALVDPEAFGVLYDRYSEQVYRFVYRRLGHRETAEDVTAEVFFKALRALDSYRPATAPFAAWLFRIAANAVTDHLRARRATVSLDLAADAADRAEPVDSQAIRRLQAAQVWAAVERLTQAQRAAVTLRLGHDLPIADIAGRLGRSEGAVKLLLNRGLAAVRAHLDSAVVGEETGR
jgi:RNA polymerase sigma-70 factor (ECF subfamily)